MTRARRVSVVTAHSGDDRAPRVALGWLALLAAVWCCLCAGAARSAWLRPVQGAGNFYSTVDVVNIWQDETTLDVVVMVAVANNEVKFVEEDGHQEGQLEVEIRLTAEDGTEVTRQRTVELRVARDEETASATLFQIFNVVLSDVPFRSGRLVCRIYDQNRHRRGLFNQINKNRARSESAADWSAAEDRRIAAGPTVSDPVYLASAPILLWQSGAIRPPDPADSPVFAYNHPTRRYGLEQDRLQLYFEVEPANEAGKAGVEEPGLLLRIYSTDPEFALQDTIDLDENAQRALAQGRAAGVFYELDINILPPGSFYLGITPLAQGGRGMLSVFDVTWRLGVLTRHADELLGEGRTVFRDRQLDEFLAASNADREVMLEQFWYGLDPDPATPANEVYYEFRRRVAFVRRYLGGFGRAGAADPRGEVYLLLGAPDQVENESIPMNPDDQDDARIKVYEPYAPDREGVWTKGTGGTYNSDAPVPMPYSRLGAQDILANRTSGARYNAYELWRYLNAGQQLFENQYTGGSMGLRFLFVDKTGSGQYVLNSSNAFMQDD